MNWTMPYPWRSRCDSVRRINMSSEPGNESFFFGLRPIPRILGLGQERTQVKTGVATVRNGAVRIAISRARRHVAAHPVAASIAPQSTHINSRWFHLAATTRHFSASRSLMLASFGCRLCKSWLLPRALPADLGSAGTCPFRTASAAAKPLPVADHAISVLGNLLWNAPPVRFQ